MMAAVAAPAAAEHRAVKSDVGFWPEWRYSAALQAFAGLPDEEAAARAYPALPVLECGLPQVSVLRRRPEEAAGEVRRAPVQAGKSACCEMESLAGPELREWRPEPRVQVWRKA
jgi:hypothetical protein